MLEDPRVSSAIREAYAAHQADPRIVPSCADDFNDALMFPATFDRYGSEGVNLENTWTSTQCTITRRGVGTGNEPCAFTITWFDQTTTHIKQTNAGAISTGMGEASFFWAGGPTQATLFQYNEAMGAGCSQQLVNLLRLEERGDPQGQLRGCGLTIVLQSTCQHDEWHDGYFWLNPS
jgi:hypothetical protein